MKKSVFSNLSGTPPFFPHTRLCSFLPKNHSAFNSLQCDHKAYILIDFPPTVYKLLAVLRKLRTTQYERFKTNKLHFTD